MFVLPLILRVVIAVVQLVVIIGVVVFDWLVWSLNYWVPKKRERPKILTEETYGAHYYVDVSKKTRLHYVSNDNRDCPLLLFIHGFPGCWYSWRHQLTEFQEDYWTVSVDLKGFGDSSKPLEVSEYSSQVLIDDVYNLIRYLGAEKCVLVCHGYGGFIGWQFVEKYPDMVSCYIPIGCPHYESRTSLAAWDSLTTCYMELLRIPHLGEVYLKTNDLMFVNRIRNLNPSRVRSGIKISDLGIYKYIMNQPGTLQCYLNYYRANPAWYRGGLLFQSKVLDVPVLLICGSDDPDLDRATESAHYVVDLTIEVIEKTNKFVHENAHEEVNQLMRDFMATKSF